MIVGTPLSGARRKYLEAIIGGQPALAHAVVDEALSSGVGEAQVCLDILAPAQREIGELWFSGEINIGQEHLATMITLSVLDDLRNRRTPRTVIGLRVVVAPIVGDQHSIGGRFVAEFFGMDGWDVDFLGDAVPPNDLAAFVRDRRADVLALSATVSDNLPGVIETSRAIQGLEESAPSIILGGQALEGRSAKPESYGCDAIVTDAVDAVRVARRLVGLADSRPTLEQQLSALGASINAIRSRRRMTQKQLAEACGLDRTYISMVENGRQNLSFGALSRIANALDTPIGDLVAVRSGRGQEG
ncbi:MAG: helix-turn-helix domain-containing protein [Dehalococcoidia bacterium]|nr:helix-turn-helix domain-containing protein [Dehalococcoidia bacterium]